MTYTPLHTDGFVELSSGFVVMHDPRCASIPRLTVERRRTKLVVGIRCTCDAAELVAIVMPNGRRAVDAK